MDTGIIYNIQRMSGQDGPGLRTTVFLKGCPLSCQWCSNPESQDRRPQLMVFPKLCSGCGACISACPQQAIVMDGDHRSRTDRQKCVSCGACAAVCPHKAREISGRAMTVAEVMRVVEKDELFYQNSGGGVTFCGGEPTASGEFLLELMQACHNRGYHICLDTCGHCEQNAFLKAAAASDLILFDCKHMDTAIHKQFTGVGNELILSNLKNILERHYAVRIRIPLMPGVNDTESNITALAEFLKPYGIFDVDILPCHTFGSSKYEALGLNQPSQVPYPKEELKLILQRFERNGLHTAIV